MPWGGEMYSLMQPQHVPAHTLGGQAGQGAAAGQWWVRLRNKCTGIKQTTHTSVK